MRSYNPTTQGHKGQIKRGLKALLAAKKPVLYVGGGAIMADCSPQLIKLAESLNIPVVNTLMGLGAFPGTHKNNLGMLGMHGTYEANMAMHNSDLIFGIGVRFDDRTTNNVEKYCPNATIMHIDVDPSSISKTISVDIPIVGSADTVLNCMVKMLDEQNGQNDDAAIDTWWSEIESWRGRQCLSYKKG